MEFEKKNRQNHGKYMEYHGNFLSDKILCIIFVLAELQRLWQASTAIKHAAHDTCISFYEHFGWTATREMGGLVSDFVLFQPQYYMFWVVKVP